MTYPGRVLRRGRAMALVAAASFALSTTACSGGPEQETAGASASVHGVADWVPIFPGARVSGIERRDAGVETWTTFQLDSTSDCQRVFAWYDEKLKLAGFNVRRDVNTADGCTGALDAQGPGRTRWLLVTGGGGTGGPSRFDFRAVVRQLPGAGAAGPAATIPAWIPQYPGSKPANLVARDDGYERTADFSFTTADAAQTVIGWYERKLKDAHFTIVTSSGGGSSGQMTAQDTTGRSILTIQVVPAGGSKVVTIAARERAR
jgi:hypothetical protein